MAEAGASSVHVAADFGIYGRWRDESVDVVRTGSPYVVDPGAIRKADGTPFKVFTPFLRAWRARPVDPPQEAPTDVRWAGGLRSEPIPDDPPGVSPHLPAAGEAAAHEPQGSPASK